MFRPGNGEYSFWNMLVTNTKLVMACELFSGQNLTSESVPMSWLVAFDLVNATVRPMMASSLVPGVVNFELGMDHYQAKNGKEYIRFTTMRFDNMTDYHQSNPEAFPSRYTYLEISELGSDGIGAHDDLQPVSVELAGLFESNITVVSAAYTANAVVVAAQTDDKTTHTVYTIDTTDPDNPRVAGELSIPVTALRVFSMDNNWMIGIGSLETTNGTEYPLPQPLQLFAWDVSDRQGPMHVAYHWINDAMPVSNGTGINSTVSQVFANVIDPFVASSTLQYDDESSILVLPVQIEQYKSRPCTSYDYGAYSNPARSSQNQSLPVNCWDNDKTLFDGFWLFKVDLTAVTNRSGFNYRNMTKHFEIDHASPNLLRQECLDRSQSDGSLPTHSLVFDGDIMTFKRSAVLTHDLLTKAEAAPAVILGNAECN
jgi:Beta propeller domain